MLVSLNKGMAAMFVSLTSPLGIELYYHANVCSCFGGKTRLLITRVKTLYTVYELISKSKRANKNAGNAISAIKTLINI